MDFVLKRMDFVLKMMDFVFKMMILIQTTRRDSGALRSRQAV